MKQANDAAVLSSSNVAGGERVKPAADESSWGAIKDLLKGLASLKLTVTLLCLGIFLVFAGTLVQREMGIWTVIEAYFRSPIAWIDLRIFFPLSWNVPGSFPFPGGWMLGSLLLINILSAHAVRFKIRAQGGRRTLGMLVLALGLVLTWLVLAGYFTKDLAATQDDAFWRVLLRLAKGGFAALVLMAGCILLFAKRSGIVLLHSGIILMLLGELITGLYAVEGTMRIEEGGSANFVRHTTSSELAIIDPSDSDYDDVIAVPQGLLDQSVKIEHEDLPFNIEPLRYMKNANLVPLDATLEAGAPKPIQATAGIGLERIAVPAREVAGTDTDQVVDAPAAYIRLTRKDNGEPLGTYLVSVFQAHIPQPVRVDGKEYNLHLRFKRTYKPYQIHLIDFRHDRYLGTNKPKNFSSEIRLVDPQKNVDREVKIWMNNPLRYSGETFYQASFEGEQVTVLQVVKNVGWMIPYVSCMIVACGMIVHFGSNLLTFLRRRYAA